MGVHQSLDRMDHYKSFSKDKLQKKYLKYTELQEFRISK